MADPVPPAVLRQRALRLRRLQADLTRQALEGLVGSELDILIEGQAPQERLEGYSDTYVLCRLQGPDALRGQVIRVTAVASAGDYLHVRVG